MDAFNYQGNSHCLLPVAAPHTHPQGLRDSDKAERIGHCHLVALGAIIFVMANLYITFLLDRIVYGKLRAGYLGLEQTNVIPHLLPKTFTIKVGKSPSLLVKSTSNWIKQL